MQTALEIYESALKSITDRCADPWFMEQLASSRAGDEVALRRISGSCLRLVLDIAKQRWNAARTVDLLDLVQEGNWVLVQTIRQFQGTSAEEFLQTVRRQVDHKLTLFVEHPGLLE